MNNCCKGQNDWSVNHPSASMKLQAEVVAFKGLIHVTEKQVAPSPKSKLVYFFAYSFITNGKVVKILILIGSKKMSSNSSELICYINEITDFHSLFAVWVLH